MIILQDILRPKYRIEKVACSSRYIRMKRQGSGLLNFVRPTYFSVYILRQARFPVPFATTKLRVISLEKMNAGNCAFARLWEVLAKDNNNPSIEEGDSFRQFSKTGALCLDASVITILKLKRF